MRLADGMLPPPSLKPFPSPAKLAIFRRFVPFRKLQQFVMITGNGAANRSNPSSQFSQARQPLITLSGPRPANLASIPSAFSPSVGPSQLWYPSQLRTRLELAGWLSWRPVSLQLWKTHNSMILELPDTFMPLSPA